MKKYEVALIDIPMFSNAKVYPLIEAYATAPQARGRLLAIWYSDIGELNQVMVLREFETSSDLDAERERMMLGGKPFGLDNELMLGLNLSTYAAFPFLPPVETGARGPVYEVRTYGIKPEGVAATIEAWKGAYAARHAVSPLLIAMYALDGQGPRFMNIWPYASTDARAKARADSVAQGVWPPKGGPAHLTTLHSAIFLPAPNSPLR